MEGVGDHNRIEALRAIGQLGSVLDGEMEPGRVHLLFGLRNRPAVRAAVSMCPELGGNRLFS